MRWGFPPPCLLYVAVADLIPGLHRRVDAQDSVLQVLLIGAGRGAGGQRGGTATALILKARSPLIRRPAPPEYRPCATTN